MNRWKCWSIMGESVVQSRNAMHGYTHINGGPTVDIIESIERRYIGTR